MCISLLTRGRLLNFRTNHVCALVILEPTTFEHLSFFLSFLKCHRVGVVTSVIFLKCHRVGV